MNAPLRSAGLLLALTFATLLPTSAVASAAAGLTTAPKRLLLAVGIDSHGVGHWPRLSYAAKDAGDVAQFFKVKAAPAFDYTATLTDSPTTSITRSRLRTQLNQLAAANTSADDIVLIYFSGHGTVDWQPGGQLARFFVTSDTSPSAVAATALSYRWLLAWFRGLKSRKKALILDFCHSGTGKSVLTPGILASINSRKGGYFPPITSAEVQGEYILSASSWRQSAGESAKLGNGIYTHFLLKGFNVDLNGDGGVSLMEAHSFARAETAKFTRLGQTPTAKVRMEGTDPIWVKAAPSSLLAAYLYPLWEGASHYRVRVNGRDLGLLGKGLAIPAGRQRLALLESPSGQVRSDRVYRFEAGKEYGLRHLLVAQPRHSLAIGWQQRWYASPAIRRRFAPAVESGPMLRYGRSGAVGLLDFYGEAGQLSAYERVAGIAQRRGTDVFSLALGWRDSLGAFTLNQQARYGGRGYWALRLGPTLQRLRLSSPAIDRDDSQWLAGGYSALSIGADLPRLGLTAGADLKLGFTTSPFAQQRGPVLSGGLQIFLGALW